MVESGQALVNRFQELIDEYGGDYGEFYVGITNDAERRLGEHRVDPDGIYTIGTARSSEVARSVEYHFHELGCVGSGGGGDDSSVEVYIYKITEDTIEST